jgi:hypothetical protein
LSHSLTFFQSEPPNLPPYAKDYIKAYGGWTGFMHSYGLKPWDHDDIEEAEMIVRSFAKADAEEKAQAKQENGTSKAERK